MLTGTEIRQMIHQKFPMHAADQNAYGEVAKRYVFDDGQGEVGIITSISQPFCHSCNRGRIASDGKFFTCLFAHKGHDLKAQLRSGKTDDEIYNSLLDIWTKRSDKYSEDRLVQKEHKEQKIEMSQIGG